MFQKLGLSHSQAIAMFYRQVTLHHGLPFDVRVPNETTLAALRGVVRHVAEGETLPPRYPDHKLPGPLRDCRECHIHPDWLRVYRFMESEMVLVRTGTHVDLLGT